MTAKPPKATLSGRSIGDTGYLATKNSRVITSESGGPERSEIAITLKRPGRDNGSRPSGNFLLGDGKIAVFYHQRYTPLPPPTHLTKNMGSHKRGNLNSSGVGDPFGKSAHEPFQKNHNLMKKYNLPSFSDLSYDSDDISQFNFFLFLSTCSSNGTLVNGSEYDVTSGPFLFPDHKFGIDFDHQHGIFKMIWQANKYTPYYFGDHFFYFFCSLGKVASSIISLFYSTFFSLVV
ncbi:hypothetical protein VP01_3027g4 [Puccinia sorghi]|uniref:Tet-like 2OG-Fe(II) oxygenase domain-containing protein n=1 Tax=Puccinia sorghi TaxID=27349 RepID=A0A0L6V1X8_9BASI|nr:hypothetical protein VP01_3027g4 [Puccinia sorghi]